MWQSTIRLLVPGTLEHRDLAVRVIAEACRLVSGGGGTRVSGDSAIDVGYDLRHPFDAAFVSAFAEIFNNIVIHSYARLGGGDVEIVIDANAEQLMVSIVDTGKPFDLDSVPTPALDELPEGGMGIHIARTMIDEVDYKPGPPNRWHLVKRFQQPVAKASGSAPR
jgi:serine/threonine-protein kinase RsbW